MVTKAAQVLCAVVVLAGYPGGAGAQEAPLLPDAEAIREMLADGAVSAARLKTAAREIAALKKRAADLDAYLKACGDKAGCTQSPNKPRN